MSHATPSHFPISLTEIFFIAICTKLNSGEDFLRLCDNSAPAFPAFLCLQRKKFVCFVGVVVNTQAHNSIMNEPNFPNAVPLNRYKTL